MDTKRRSKMTDSHGSTSVMVDHSASHSQPLLTHSNHVYKQGLFTDCQLVVGGKTKACHRLVLSACSTVLHTMLTSGMSESCTNTIHVHDFSAGTIEYILEYMYTGQMNPSRDDLQELLMASHFYQMEALTKSLAEKISPLVGPANAVSWRAFAVTYDLPQLADCCNRMLIFRFCQVVKHDEFLEMSKEEAVQYFQRCKPYANQIGHDVMLQAAVSWMSNSKETTGESGELLSCINLQACTSRCLQDAARNCDLAQCAVELLTSAIELNTPHQQRTLAYLRKGSCFVVDDAGQKRQLADIDDLDEETFMGKNCATDNGFLRVLQSSDPDINGMVSCEIRAYKAPGFEKEIVYDARHLPVVPDGCVRNPFHTSHQNTLYIIPESLEWYNQPYIECYDLSLCSWSRIPFPNSWDWIVKQATSIGEDLYILTQCLRLFKLRNDIFTQIPMNIGLVNPFTMSGRITAVHDWLYVHISISDWKTDDGLNDIVTHCYNTALGVWTKLNTTKDKNSIIYLSDTYLVDNKIYLRTSFPETLEYDIIHDVITTSTPASHCIFDTPLVLDIDSRHLGPDSSLPLLNQDEYSADVPDGYICPDHSDADNDDYQIIYTQT